MVGEIKPKVKDLILIVLLVLCRGIHADEVENIQCPVECQCIFLYDQTKCSGQELAVIPDHINAQVKLLDLSYNHFDIIPKELSKFEFLTELLLNHNRIARLDEFSLNISSLEKLDISHNNITNWKYIHPRFLHLSGKLKQLNLAHNRIDGINNKLYLSSTSLEILNLRNCSLTNLPKSFLQELTHIKHLVLAENMLIRLPLLVSDSLISLNFSYSNVQEILPNALANLPVLRTLSLAHNHIKTFSPLMSDHLEQLDISFCNLEKVSLKQLYNLKHVNLKGNRISKITNRYLSNRKLQYLDLSINSIYQIDENAMIDLSSLLSLDLSMNLLNFLNEDTFFSNRNLTILNLSRNYLTSVKYNIPSLRSLDMSYCEIQIIDEDSLTQMPALQHLYLSRNLVRKLPNKILGNSLEYLDLSMNRLSDITNDTLSHLMNLKKLNLKGNRFTAGLKASYFPKKLSRILLDDNLWRCECFCGDFRQFYDYLTKPPAKITDSFNLICHSPENVTSQPWHLACSYVWFGPNYSVQKSKVWIYVISVILAMSVIFCAILSIKRVCAVKRIREQVERQRLANEAQERIRRIRLQQRRQDAQQNAPDPRELARPPSYAEAVLLPRIDGSYASLAGSRPNINASNPDVSRRNRDRGTGSKQSSSQSGSRTDLRQGKSKRITKANNTETDNETETRQVPEPAVRPEPETEETEPRHQAVITMALPKNTVIESNL